MEKNIVNYFDSLSLGRRQSHKNLAIYPIISDYNIGVEYLTLDDALDQNAIEITEIDSDGSVPDLKVVNKSNIKILILDGEELIGAKQNRIVNTTILFPETFSAVIPVSCVEQGRWSYDSHNFSSEKRCFSPSIRAMKSEDVQHSVAQNRGHRANQSRIWDEISSKACRMEAASPSMAYREIHRKEAPRVKDYAEHFSIKQNQVGAVFLINEKIVGLEGFGKTDTLVKVFQKLTESYALDAIDWYRRDKDTKKVTMKKNTVVNFLQSILSSTCTVHKSVQLGDDCRFSSNEITGFSLIFEEELIHISAFSKKRSPNRGDRHQRMRRFSERRDDRVY